MHHVRLQAFQVLLLSFWRLHEWLHFAIRQNNMKLCLTPGSGGWSDPKPNTPAAAKLAAVQLYDLAADRAETTNLEFDREPEVKALTVLLEKFIADGRCTPGAPQRNSVVRDFSLARHNASSATRHRITPTTPCTICKRSDSSKPS